MYDFTEFLNKCNDKSHLEIYQLTVSEYNRLEREFTDKKGRDRARQIGAESYMKKLHGFMFFLINHAKPDSLSNYDFQLLKPIVQRLID